MRLRDKSIIITGASSGIGAAAARLFAAEGASLVLAARRESNLAMIAGEIAEAGGKARWLAGDVTSEAYNKALVELAISSYGGLDGAFNNAGTVGDMVAIDEMGADNWRHVIETNLTSAFYAARHQVPAMKARGGGSIVFTSSFVGHTAGTPAMGAYAASKAGMIGLTQVLAAENGRARIRVNALLPGGTRTDLAGDDPAFVEWVNSIHALKRMAEPEEIARAALFLVSDDASFVTGSAMFADGGTSITNT